MKIADRKLIRFGILIALCGIILILSPLPSIITVVGLFITGFGGSTVYPCIVHLTPKCFGEKYSSTVIGLEMAAAYVGSTCIPLAMGYISGSFGMIFVPIILLLLFLIMFIFSELSAKI